MFNNKEVKDILLKKVIFPDFSNRMTKAVVGLGSAVILSPEALDVLVLNWFVDTFDMNSGVPITLAHIQSGSADYWLGFSLIVAALVHNVGYRYFVYKSDLLKEQKKQKLIDVDKKLYEEFIVLLPSNGTAIILLKEHDFGNSHHRSGIRDLDIFVNTWNNVQKQFLDSDIEEIRNQFLTKTRSFVYELALNSYDIGEHDYYSCIPDVYRGAYDYPQHVDDKIKELNDSAKECFELYRQLIWSARNNLVV